MDYLSFSHDSRFIYFLRHGPATLYEEAQTPAPKPVPPASGGEPEQPGAPLPGPGGAGPGKTGTPVHAAPKSFHGTVDVPPATAKMRLVQIADEIVWLLASDPNASVKVVIEISAEFPNGAKDTLKRAISENQGSVRPG